MTNDARKFVNRDGMAQLLLLLALLLLVTLAVGFTAVQHLSLMPIEVVI